MDDLTEQVAAAIDAVQLWSRYNDWTLDRVPGCPIEICRYGGDDEDEIVVVERFGGNISETEALNRTVSQARAKAAIDALFSKTDQQALVIRELVEALEIIAGIRPCIDNLMGNADIARAAIAKVLP